jgi:hypothetical protein
LGGKKEFSVDNSALIFEVKLFNDQAETCSVVACMNPNYKYQVFWNRKSVPHTEINKVSLLISLPASSGMGKLEVRKANYFK